MIVAVLNNKGGTGKTTVAVNLAAGLANRSRRVLLVDLDCQGSATRSLGGEPVGIATAEGADRTAADVLLRGIPASEAITSTRVRRLDLLPGGMDLAHTDLILADVPGREGRLEEALAPLRPDYDLIICDCAPSLSMLPVNALLAADGYLVPMTPEHLALEGLNSLMDAVGRIQAGMGVRLDLIGIVFNMVRAGRFSRWSRETRDQQEIMDQVRARFGDDLFEAVIRRDPAVARAPARGVTIAEESRGGDAALDFEALTEEFLSRAWSRNDHEQKRTDTGEEDA